MKKLLSVLLITILLVGLLTGCGGKTPAGNSGGPEQQETSEPSQETKLDYPTKPVQFVICANPGGDSDTNARLLADYLTRIIGQPVVIVNMAGGGGSTGSRDVKDSTPDGYKGLFYHTTLTLNRVMDITDYFISEAFEIVSVPIVDNTTGWFVNADSPYKTLQDLVDAAKANPGTVTFATEIGASTHIAALAVEEETGAKFNCVDVGTASNKMTALLGKQVDVTSFQLGLVKDYVEAGKFRCLGLLAEERDSIYNDIPTFKEQGVNVVIPRLFFMAFPKGTPNEILDFWKDTMEELCKDPKFVADFKEKTLCDIYQGSWEEGLQMWKDQEQQMWGYKDLVTSASVEDRKQ